LRIKEKETRLTFYEHDDDDDDNISCNIGNETCFEEDIAGAMSQCVATFIFSCKAMVVFIL